jgi:hypothetical protein
VGAPAKRAIDSAQKNTPTPLSGDTRYRGEWLVTVEYVI